jgi:YVTN family beta-propeller protein
MARTLLVLSALPILLLAGCRHESPSDLTLYTGEAAAPSQPAAVRVYVSNERSNDISVIDGATNQVVATIAVGKRPRGVHLSRDGRKLFVALSGSPIGGPNVRDEDLPPADKKADGIGVVDLASGKFVGKINSGSDPESFDLSRDEKRLYVSNEDTGQASVVDVATEKVVKHLKVGYEPEGVTTSPDGKLVYVTSESANKVHVISTETDAIVSEFTTSQRPRAVAFLQDGSKAYVSCETAGVVDVVDVASSRVVKHLRPPGEGPRPMGIAASPDGSRVYVGTGRGRTLAVIDTAKDEVVAVVPDVGERVWGVGVTPDGKTIYTANGPSNDVTVIDAKTLKVVTKVKAGQSPWGVAVGR